LLNTAIYTPFDSTEPRGLCKSQACLACLLGFLRPSSLNSSTHL